MEKNTNLGAVVCRIDYSPINNILSIEEGTTSTDRQVNFVGSYDWINIYGSPSQFNFKEVEKKTVHGPYYEQQVDLFYPGEDITNIADFIDMVNQKFVVKITFSNGTIKLMGSVDSPASFYKSFDAAKGGTVCQFMCMTTEPAYLYEN